jgi:gp16 family phage-associated protein
MTNGLPTVEEVRAEFAARGVTVTEWAHAHGVSPAAVYALLSGRTKGRRGSTHAIAVALGLKAPPCANERFQCLDLQGKTETTMADNSSAGLANEKGR